MIERVLNFVRNENSIRLARRYEAWLEKRVVNLGLNPFAIVSDVFYRENFHSDILRVLIDPKTEHNEGDKYLRLFLDFLRSHDVPLSESAYTNASVIREEGRIDILIKTDNSPKKAIIIENKINNAGAWTNNFSGTFTW